MKCLEPEFTTSLPPGDDIGSNDPSPNTTQRMEQLDEEVAQMYDLHKKLGKGAYGVVWEATQKSSGQKVALKKIFDAFRNTTDSQRTYREVIFLKAFGHHPNMITVIGGHKALNNMDLYLVFPLLKFDLFKLIERNPAALTESRTKYVAYQIALAVKYLHSAEVIHRDLKPANILMDEQLNVQLADMGLSRTIPEEGECSLYNNNYKNHPQWKADLTDYVATRWYRPPEIIVSSRVYCKPIDMWAFGCIVGEMLLKRVIFPGSSAENQLQLMLEAILPPSEEEITSLCKDVEHKYVELIYSILSQRSGPLIADLFENFDLPTVDILERLLRFSPEDRLGIDDVLNHPYFSRIRDVSQELDAPCAFQPPIHDSILLSMQEYRETIYGMVDRNEIISDVVPFHSRPPPISGNIPPPPPSAYAVELQNGHTGWTDDEEYIDPHNEDNSQNGDYEYVFGQHEEQEERDAYPHNSDSEVEVSYQSAADNQALLAITEETAFTDFQVPAPQSYRSHRSGAHACHSDGETGGSSSASSENLESQSKLESSKPRSNLTLPSGNRGNQVEELDIFKKFELLCQKHDLDTSDFEDFSTAKKQRGITPAPAKGINDWTGSGSGPKSPNGYKDWGFIPRDVYEKATLGKMPKHGTRVNTALTLTKRRMHGRGDMGEIFSDNDNDYSKDMQRIQDTVARQTDTKGFVNPYKPKGLKTSSASTDIPRSMLDSGTGTEDQEFSEYADGAGGDNLDYLKHGPRHSRSLPNQNQKIFRGIGIGSDKKGGLPRIDEIRSLRSYDTDGLKEINKSMKGVASNMQNYLKNSSSVGEGIDFRPNKNRSSLGGHHSELGNKGRASTSQESTLVRNRPNNKHRSVNDSLYVNGRQLDASKGALAKQPTEYAKSKFSFTPYAKVEAPPEPPKRPFVGRSYIKTFHGPTFKRRPAPLHSHSDTEVITASSHLHKSSLGVSAKKSNSAYFPISSHRPFQTISVTRPREGFATVYPTKSSGVNSNNRNVSQSQPQNNLNAKAKGTNDFNAPDSVIISSSDLTRLKNNTRGPGNLTKPNYLR